MEIIFKDSDNTDLIYYEKLLTYFKMSTYQQAKLKKEAEMQVTKNNK